MWARIYYFLIIVFMAFIRLLLRFDAFCLLFCPPLFVGDSMFWRVVLVLFFFPFVMYGNSSGVILLYFHVITVNRHEKWDFRSFGGDWTIVWGPGIKLGHWQWHRAKPFPAHLQVRRNLKKISGGIISLSSLFLYRSLSKYCSCTLVSCSTDFLFSSLTR